MINNFPEEIIGIEASPAADHLFNIQKSDNTRILPLEQAISFHHNVVKLYLRVHVLGKTCRHQ